MKQLVLIGGPMGVGKTSACGILKKSLPNCVFLDGDWCWDMHPFQVTQETKAMVMENIAFLLNRFLGCSQFETVLFCWVLHQQSILDDLLSRLELSGCRVISISLVCSAEELTQRLMGDVAAGIRTQDVIRRSLDRISCYQKLNTIKIDTTGCSAQATARRVRSLLQEESSARRDADV